VVDAQTRRVYETKAASWVRRGAERDHSDDLRHAAWVAERRQPGPVADIGCGPGWHLAPVEGQTVALDGAKAMLDLVPDHAPAALRVQAGAEALPFATGALGGAILNRVLVHLPQASVPMALADLHRALSADATAFVALFGNGGHTDETTDVRPATGPFRNRLFSLWDDQRLQDVCDGAGFITEAWETVADRGPTARINLRLRRRHTLADTVGPDMRLLICGLNPSPSSADDGVGFARPGNRFWPAALASGLVGVDRDPRRALADHGIGMTDLVKRPTRRADELTVDEYRSGFDRVERLTRWLQPRAVCFVGLSGWRAAVDRRAGAGIQPGTVGGRPVYLMPSTSGLNAHARIETLVDHLEAAADLADRATA
jgi:TDG/mug DNA glycosylase family protein